MTFTATGQSGQVAVANTTPRPRYVCTETHAVRVYDTTCARCGATVGAQHYSVDDSTVIVDCPRCFSRLVEISPR
jgi:DNA-directed RNA polymerase subunit RPC12/RpoP